MSLSAGPGLTQYKSVSYPGPGTVNQGPSVSNPGSGGGLGGTGIVTQGGIQFVTQGGAKIIKG